ncbi:MAG TPA: hypothetical protein VGE50_07685 [Gammaproteobacteria bacterium]
MLGGGEYVSAALNLLIAAYLIFFYPRSVRRQFRNKPAVPPLFSKLMKLVPIAGVLLATATITYVGLRLTGVIGQ